MRSGQAEGRHVERPDSSHGRRSGQRASHATLCKNAAHCDAKAADGVQVYELGKDQASVV